MTDNTTVGPPSSGSHQSSVDHRGPDSGAVISCRTEGVGDTISTHLAEPGLSEPLTSRSNLTSIENVADTIDPKIKGLVCTHCWETVFSTQFMSALWEGRDEEQRNGRPDYEARLTYRTPPWAEIRASARSCGYCTLLCATITHGTPRRNYPGPSADETFLVTVLLDLDHSEGYCLSIKVRKEIGIAVLHYGLYVEPDDPAAQYIAARNVVWRLDDESYELALQCIQDCSRHERCPSPVPTTLPTRVLDCADPLRLRLITPHGSQHELYVALSYVWGEGQPHRTTTKNINAYHTFIDPVLVPKTIQDAITVTRRLGLRYLWVDSFCIIQDSDDDKACEIAKIRSNFRNSFLTIVAARPKTVSEGFLHDILPSHRYPRIHLPFQCPDGAMGTIIVNLRDLRGIFEATDERAWCLEERVLSPRLLMFCTVAVRYECQTGQRNLNASPLLLQPTIPRLPDYVFNFDAEVEQTPQWQADMAWDIILKMYTMRALTKEKDKLSALAGIAEQVHRLHPHSRYAAGIWSHELPYALLWKQARRRPRPTVYRAPSWSWASVDGEVMGRGGTDVEAWRPAAYQPRLKAISEVMSLDVTLKHQYNPYGEVTAAHLVLSTTFIRATWNAGEMDGLRQLKIDENGRFWILQYEDMTGEVGIAELDAMEHSELVSSAELLLVGVTKTDVPLPMILRAGQADIHGLMLLPAFEDTQSGFTVYRRIGYFTVNAEVWPSSERQDLYIV